MFCLHYDTNLFAFQVEIQQNLLPHSLTQTIDTYIHVITILSYKKFYEDCLRSEILTFFLLTRSANLLIVHLDLSGLNRSINVIPHSQIAKPKGPAKNNSLLANGVQFPPGQILSMA